MQFAPDDARPQRSLARALFKSGRVEEAIAIYHRVLERYPCDVLAYFGLGCVLQSVQRHDEAIGVFQDAIAHEPRAGAVHAYLADSLSAVGCASEAIASYRRALRHDPADLDTARKLLGLLRETWRHSESVEIYRILLRDKLDVEDLRDFGLLLLDLGESQEAERVLRQASQRAHDRADVRADVAMRALQIRVDSQNRLMR